jgi:Ni/Fe-hydrogenase subunit HybB-like protein
MEADNYRSVDDAILASLGRPRLRFDALVIFLFLGALVGAACWALQIFRGLGIAGYAHPVYWIIYLTNFVFWIGIGHSGTLISAILYLFRAKWRTGISRSAEAMTIFCVAIAGMFPIIHLGRSYIFYWLLPYPNQRTLWPNFQSPLIFDVFAVSTYFTVSLLFWYLGMVPDLAVIRDRSQGIRRKIYGLFSLGWTGNHRQWHHYGTAYLILAGLATPLVLSVHSVVSWDFAMIIVPGYHDTIFAPYFVDGAIHSGLAMVLILLIPLRRIYKFQNFVTLSDLESIAKAMIVTGAFIGYCYGTEMFMAWYSGNRFERDMVLFRLLGQYRVSYYLALVFNIAAPMFLLSKRIRTNTKGLFIIALFVITGMYLERYFIVLGPIARDYDPYNWGVYVPELVETLITLGSVSFFFFLFLLFAKFLPSVSIAESKEDLEPPLRHPRGGR